MTVQSMVQYKLAAVAEQTIEMPVDAIILSVQCHQGRVTMWASATPGMKTIERTFYQVGATAKLPAKCGQYIGTVQVDDGIFVIHIFEENYSA